MSRQMIASTPERSATLPLRRRKVADEALRPSPTGAWQLGRGAHRLPGRGGLRSRRSSQRRGRLRRRVPKRALSGRHPGHEHVSGRPQPGPRGGRVLPATAHRPDAACPGCLQRTGCHGTDLGAGARFAAGRYGRPGPGGQLRPGPGATGAPRGSRRRDHHDRTAQSLRNAPDQHRGRRHRNRRARRQPQREGPGRRISHEHRGRQRACEHSGGR